MPSKDEQQFCVIGLGAYGFSLAKNLAKNGAYVLAVDNRNEQIEAIKPHVADAVEFDATDASLLHEMGVTSADVVIIAIGEKFEPVVLIAMELLKAGVKRIVARASNDTQEMILKRIGIQEVIHPESDEGKRMASHLVHAHITDYFELSGDIAIFEIETPEGLVGFTLEELDMRNRYQLNVLVVKRWLSEDKRTEKGQFYDVEVVDAQTKIREQDRLVILGHEANIRKLVDTN
ncbi:MAG: potassium channel family protein [Bacteroidota bacterium]